MAAAAPKPQTSFSPPSAPSNVVVSPRRVAPAPRRTPQTRPVPVAPREEIPAEIKIEAAQKRARSRARTHRPLRLTWTAVLCVSALMGQLVLLLWMHGRALSAAREVDHLDAQIVLTANQIERTQERIAAYDSAPRIAQWAKELGWRPAGHLDFDDVTKSGVAMPMPSATNSSASTSDNTMTPDNDAGEVR